jgi:hypothetical protein
METVQLHLDIQNSLVDTLKQTEITMKRFNSLLDNSQRMTKVVDDHFDDIEKSTKKIKEHSEMWSKVLGKVGSMAREIAQPFAIIFSVATMIDATKAAFRHHTEMKQLSYRMGEAGKTTQLYYDQLYKVSLETGVATEKTAGLNWYGS